MRTAVIPIAPARPAAACPDCTDYDEDCEDLPGDPHDHLACWLYDPARGMCPYLRAPVPRA